MIYVVLNLVMTVFFVGLAFYIGNQTKEEVNNPLTGMSVAMALATALFAGTVWTTFAYIDRLPQLFFKLSLLCAAYYAVELCLYYILFPSYERPLWAKVLKGAVLLFAAWICFSQIQDLTITSFIGLKVDAVPLFTGTLTNYFPVTWYDLFINVFEIGLPAMSVLIMILRAENREERLNMQKAIINALALIAGWFAIYMIGKATGRVKLFSTLLYTGVGVNLVILSYNARQNFLFDFKYTIGVIISFSLSYAIPAMGIGFIFPKLWPLFSSAPALFFLFVLLALFVCITASYQVSKFLTRKQYFRSFQYAETFEESLSTMDYSGEPEEIVKTMKDIFKRNLGLERIQVLVENEGKLESIFDDPGCSSMSLDIKNKVFDTLLNQNKLVALKSSAENSHTDENSRREMLEFFTNTDSEAVILLAEGRHLIGVLLLGQKAGGNIYADYDYNIFTKLYSYFFVFGYYMKNIAHQSIVGTINREIRMSSQIITSIQENMDPVKNPHYDTGYIMEHAHNIGGEFVDLIRLTENRHIFVLGDLSGKGISASMSMVIVKSIIRTYLQETRDFKLLVEKVNQFIRYNLPKGTFFEGVFGLIDFTDDTLYYINCGVPSLFLYTRSYNNVIEIQGDGRVLGFVKDIGHLIKVKKVKLNPGDIIVTCTDGLIDSKSLRGEVYGKERIQKSITESTGFPAESIANSMYQSAVNFLSKELDDDVSILVIKRLSK